MFYGLGLCRAFLHFCSQNKDLVVQKLQSRVWSKDDFATTTGTATVAAGVEEYTVEGLLYNCPDASNVMFPVAGFYADELSPMQRRVLHGSTLYHGERLVADE